MTLGIYYGTPLSFTQVLFPLLDWHIVRVFVPFKMAKPRIKVIEVGIYTLSIRKEDYLHFIHYFIYIDIIHYYRYCLTPSVIRIGVNGFSFDSLPLSQFYLHILSVISLRVTKGFGTRIDGTMGRSF